MTTRRALLTVTSIGSRSDAVTKQLAMTENERIAVDSNGLAACMKGQLIYEPDIAKPTATSRSGSRMQGCARW